MRCEIIAVGTELLLGQIVDSNSSWMGEQLALAGIDSHHQTKVGDNQARIVACIRLALERSEAVILCGGLGPTQDDITRESIAEVLGVALRRDEAMAAHIRALFEHRRRRFAENNLRQADLPEGAAFIEQMPGTAPGLICPLGDKVIYAVPGVPHEMRDMVNGSILPDLQRRTGISAVIRSRVLRTWGESESGLAEMLHDRIEALDVAGNPTLAFQASGIEGLKVRITAKAPSEDEARALIDAEEAEVRAVIGDAVFGVDDTNMEAAVLQLLRERGMTLAAAESVTGGLLAARLTEIPDAAGVFRGAITLAAPELLRSELGVTADAIVSEDCAKAMAVAAREKLGADAGVAVTGVAGPDELDGHPVGQVFLGVSFGDHLEARPVRLPGDRRRIRQFGVISVLNLLRLRLIGSDREAVMR